MGYRSDVAIAIPKETYKELLISAQDIIDEQLRNSVFNLLTNICKQKIIEKDSDYMVLLYEGIKWYGDDVKFLESNLVGKSYDMIIIGEDYDDIEIYYGTDEYLIELERKIIFS